MQKIDWIKKLTSRKFWLAVAGLVTGIISFVTKPTTDAQTISALILALGSVVAYCIGEGLADAANVQPQVVYYPLDAVPDDGKIQPDAEPVEDPEQ